MSNSNLVNYTRISPNKSVPRNHKIDKITIHHMAGNLSVETCGNVFAPASRQASSNYGIDSNGRVGMYVEEKDRSWCTSSPENDNRAVTIEVANDEIGGNWHVSDDALAKLIDLCVDICKRNGIKSLNYTGGKDGNLTMHKWYANTSCPGPYLSSKFPYIASEVNKRLAGTPAEDGVLEEYGGFITVTYKGKDGLAVHGSPAWGDSTVVETIYGGVYTVVGRILVDGVYMYKLKSGKYITSAPEYVAWHSELHNGPGSGSSKPAEPVAPKMREGAKVKYSGYLYRDSLGNGRGARVSGTYTITIYNSNKYGAHLNGLGWVKPGDCTVIE